MGRGRTAGEIGGRGGGGARRAAAPSPATGLPPAPQPANLVAHRPSGRRCWPRRRRARPRAPRMVILRRGRCGAQDGTRLVCTDHPATRKLSNSTARAHPPPLRDTPDLASSVPGRSTGPGRAAGWRAAARRPARRRRAHVPPATPRPPGSARGALLARLRRADRLVRPRPPAAACAARVDRSSACCGAVRGRWAAREAAEHRLTTAHRRAARELRAARAIVAAACRRYPC